MASSASAPSPAAPPSLQLSFTELFNKWIQSIGIIGAAIWGAYTFVYKEIIQPKAAPVNITINLQLKRAGASKPKTSLVPVEMRISATNPSSRKIYLLPNKWLVWGYKTVPKNDTTDAFYELAADAMNKRLARVAERYASYGKGSIVAGGSIFSDLTLNPGETLARTIIFYVPLDQCDSIFAQTVISSLEAPSGLELEWKFDKNSETIQSTVYVVNERNERRLAKTGQSGEIKDERAKELGFQVATSSAELSLWNEALK